VSRARAAAAAGRFDVLLFYRVDRLSRNLGDLITIGKELQSHGVGLRSATESFDTEDPAGRMLFQLLGSFAEFERTTMHGRINEPWRRRAARGEWTGGVAPFGYRKEHDETFLRPDPVTAPIVAAIFTATSRPATVPATIASWLDSGRHPDSQRRPLVGFGSPGSAATADLHGRGQLPR